MEGLAQLEALCERLYNSQDSAERAHTENALKCFSINTEYISQCQYILDNALTPYALMLANKYMIGKMLLKLDTVKFIITNYTREHLPFLEEYRCSRSRTTFYYTIGLLIFMEGSPAQFKSFMEPLQQVSLHFYSILSRTSICWIELPHVFVTLESIPDSMFRTDVVKYALIGLMRDLRGITMATNSDRTYGLLFHWLYPAHFPLLLKGVSHWTDMPEVTTTLLKFMAEFVWNKAQRLTFDSSSPNGIPLFREVSKLIVAYGSRILSLPNGADIYSFKYKGICICLTILSRALQGNYVNFGVFGLYGDKAFPDVLDIVKTTILSIPLADMLAYWKLTRAYFAFLEILFDNHIKFVLNLDTCIFKHIVVSFELGLQVLDTNISSQGASAIDNLADFYFNNITMGESPTSPATRNLARHSMDCPNLLPEIFPDLEARILSSQPAHQHQRLSLCFDKLMADVSRSLDHSEQGQVHSEPHHV